MPLDEALLRRLRDDYPFFAEYVLRIHTKAGGDPVAFRLNRAQRYIHQQLEAQRAKTGMVRAIVLKGRQQGCSTYVQGRFYHRTAMNFGVKAYILTHEIKATQNLFGIAQTFWEQSDPTVRPQRGIANANAMVFDSLNSGYSVATAGSKDTGRSGTAQLFHGSEVAFWDNATSHMAGLGQVVPPVRGSEIILESTGNGVGNLFHQAWQMAEAGKSEYVAIFTPWWWNDEYAKELPTGGWIFSDEDIAYGNLYQLTPQQLYWRRMKINTDFAGDEVWFQQEYPATAAEAFVQVGHDSLVHPQYVLAARKEQINEPYGALVLGVDPARFGDDRTALVWRRGRKVLRCEALNGRSTMEVAGYVAQIIRRDRITRAFIDVVGIGAGVVDRLRELELESVITPVTAGGKADDPERFINKRAEMWWRMKEWFEDKPVQIPDVDELHADIVNPRYTRESNQRLKLESKEEMRKRQIRSPDLGDALAMTFAYPVGMDDVPHEDTEAPHRIRRRVYSWQAR